LGCGAAAMAVPLRTRPYYQCSVGVMPAVMRAGMRRR
jgi:hypothetical protein